MSLNLICFLIVYSFGMACGQLLFKLAARYVENQAGVENYLSYLNLYSVLGMALYFLLTVLWIWILRHVPLSKAYPFAALAFVITPLLAWLMFDERLSLQSLVGIGLVTLGVVVVAQQ
jgi:multidrug transporter EmrE-like cation transporter